MYISILSTNCWCFCTSDAFHNKIRSDSSEQVCDSCWIRHGGMNPSGNTFPGRNVNPRPDLWIYSFQPSRRKFRSQTSDNMDRWKAELGRCRDKRRVEERRSEKRKSHKKKDADARKGRKVAKQSFFPMICGSGGSKSRLAKAAGAEPSGQMKMKKCTPLWREAHL